LSLTNLFGQGRQSAGQIRAAVDALPRYFSQNVITPDRRTANIAFRMGAMPPEERRRVVDVLRAEIDPPPGVDADLAGPVVTAAGRGRRGQHVGDALALVARRCRRGAAARPGGLLVAIPWARDRWAF
jgi:hypothetical protein